MQKFDAGLELKASLDRIMAHVREDNDYFLCIEGMERSGKSTLAFIIAHYCDPDFDVKNIVYNTADFIKAVRNAKKGGVVWVDEGFLVFCATESNTKEARRVLKLITVCGEKNLLIIVVVPSIMLIHRYIREERMRSFIRVYRVKGKKGQYVFFGKRALKKHLIIKKKGSSKGIGKPQYLYRERFKEVKGPAWDAYVRKKEADVNEYEDFQEREEEGQLTQLSHIAKMWDMKVQSLKKVVKEKGIPYKESKSGRLFLEKKGLALLKAEYFVQDNEDNL